VPALDVTQPRGVAGGARALSSEQKPDKLVNGRLLGASAIVLALAVVAAGALLMLRGRSSVSTTPPQAATAARGPGQVLGLVGPFMDRGDWSDARLTTLNAALLELGGSQIGEVAQDARFQRFVDALRARLKEQQALSSTALTADNSPLAALAVTVGIDLNSPDSALHVTAQLPPPPAPPPDTAPTVAQARPAPHHLAAHAPEVTADSGTADSAMRTTQSDEPAVSSAGATHAAAPNVPPAAVPGPAQASSSAATVDTHEGACRLDLIRSRRPVCHDVLPDGSEGPMLALIPAGAFDMGSTASSEEQPVHHVTIRQPFAISIYEVSQGEFKQYCASAKHQCATQPWVGDDYPVVNVSWEDARAYTDWLSASTHHHYSLPTEAQWEYAARAGRTGLFPSGDALSPTDALFSGPGRQTAAARRSQTFNANAFRLLHTVGNVREWVQDSWTQNFSGAPDDGSAVNSTQTTSHVARGGSYADSAIRLRLSLREGLPLSTRDAITGFRIVRELP